MIPSVYVAGVSKELERCKYWIAELEKTGIRVTTDWTKPVEKYGSSGVELSQAEKWFFARANLRGIQESDIMWLLAPPPEATSIGMWIEFGYSFWQVRKILISPPVSDRCIFATLPQVLEFATDEEAYKFIQEYRA